MPSSPMSTLSGGVNVVSSPVVLLAPSSLPSDCTVMVVNDTNAAGTS